MKLTPRERFEMTCDTLTDPFTEHAYREQLENQDEVDGTPVRMPYWLIAAITVGIVCWGWGWAGAILWEMR